MTTNGNENFYQFIGKEIIKSEKENEPNLVIFTHGYNVGDPQRPKGCVVRTTLVRGESVSASSLFVPEAFLSPRLVHDSKDKTKRVYKGMTLEIPGSIRYSAGR